MFGPVLMWRNKSCMSHLCALLCIPFWADRTVRFDMQSRCRQACVESMAFLCRMPACSTEELVQDGAPLRMTSSKPPCASGPGARAGPARRPALGVGGGRAGCGGRGRGHAGRCAEGARRPRRQPVPVRLVHARRPVRARPAACPAACVCSLSAPPIWRRPRRSRWQPHGVPRARCLSGPVQCDAVTAVAMRLRRGEARSPAWRKQLLTSRTTECKGLAQAAAWATCRSLWHTQNHIAALHKWLTRRMDRGGDVAAGMAWTCWSRMCWTRATCPSRTTASSAARTAPSHPCTGAPRARRRRAWPDRIEQGRAAFVAWDECLDVGECHVFGCSEQLAVQLGLPAGLWRPPNAILS